MTLEQCSDLKSLAESLGVSFAAIPTDTGYVVFLAGEGRGYERYSDGIVFLTRRHPKVACAPYQYCLRDLEKAACYYELGMLEEAWDAIERLPEHRKVADDVQMLRMEILSGEGHWDVVVDLTLEAAGSRFGNLGEPSAGLQ